MSQRFESLLYHLLTVDLGQLSNLSEFHFLIYQMETRISDLLCLSNDYDRNDNVTVARVTTIALVVSTFNKY